MRLALSISNLITIFNNFRLSILNGQFSFAITHKQTNNIIIIIIIICMYTVCIVHTGLIIPETP